MLLVCGFGFGEAEVDQTNRILISYHNVVWLDVSVDDVLFV